MCVLDTFTFFYIISFQNNLLIIYKRKYRVKTLAFRTAELNNADLTTFKECPRYTNYCPR